MFLNEKTAASRPWRPAPAELRSTGLDLGEALEGAQGTHVRHMGRDRPYCAAEVKHAAGLALEQRSTRRCTRRNSVGDVPHLNIIGHVAVRD